MIRAARASDMSVIDSLWQTCFPEGSAYDRYLLSHVLLPQRCLLAEEGGTVRAMTHILPCTLCIPDASGGYIARPAGYIFGVGTHPDSRGQGLAQALLHAAHTLLADQGASYAFLIPASAPLFAYYTRAGYRTAFFAQRHKLRADMLSPAKGRYAVRPLTDGDIPALDMLYRGLMAHRVHLFRDGHWPHVIGACRADSGDALGLFEGTRLCAAAVGAPDADDAQGLLLDECLFDTVETRDALLYAAAVRFNAHTVRYACPVPPDESGEPLGMLLSLGDAPALHGTGQAAYINLLFN